MRTLIFGSNSDMSDPIRIMCPNSYDAGVDVTYFRDVEDRVRVVQPELIVNLAGVSHVQKIHNSAIDHWRREMEVNLLGAYHIARAATHHTPRAIMIFMASVAGLYGKPNHSGYCASKAGLISLVQSLGMEGYHAFCISPGRVNTKMREHDYPNEDVRTRLTVGEVANVVKRICEGEWAPGSNIWIRKQGYETFGPEQEHTASSRRRWLNVQPQSK